MKIELHRTNYNSSEAQNFTEQSTHDYKHTVNFPDFFLGIKQKQKIRQT